MFSREPWGFSGAAEKINISLKAQMGQSPNRRHKNIHTYLFHFFVFPVNSAFEQLILW